MGHDLLAAAQAVFQPNLYDNVLGLEPDGIGSPADRIGAFAGRAFNAADISGHLSDWPTPR
jgi:NitT/TauT family transport system ATP-binding protein